MVIIKTYLNPTLSFRRTKLFGLLIRHNEFLNTFSKVRFMVKEAEEDLDHLSSRAICHTLNCTNHKTPRETAKITAFGFNDNNNA